MLNDYENHRTDTEYDNNLIAKSFLFKFINSNVTLIYIAFFKSNDVFTPDKINRCANDDCLPELQYQLLIIFAVQIFMNNALEIIMPRFWAWKKSRDESKGAEHKTKSTAEKE